MCQQSHIIIVDDTPNPERLSVPFLYALDISVIDVIGDNGAHDPILSGPNAGLADCCSIRNWNENEQRANLGLSWRLHWIELYRLAWSHY